ncbi:hypothetical protein [Desulfotomaculum nigrificans]|nr:hypothetical protein [Desulfotomaculum nigrificans]
MEKKARNTNKQSAEEITRRVTKIPKHERTYGGTKEPTPMA